MKVEIKGRLRTDGRVYRISDETIIRTYADNDCRKSDVAKMWLMIKDFSDDLEAAAKKCERVYCDDLPIQGIMDIVNMLMAFAHQIEPYACMDILAFDETSMAPTDVIICTSNYTISILDE